MLEPTYIDNSLKDYRSKANVCRLIELAMQEGIDFGALFEHIKSVDESRKWHFTWLLTHLIEADPKLGNENQFLIWKELKQTTQSGMQRDLWRSLTFIDIDESISGEVFSSGLKVVTSQKHAIAIRAHCMLAITRIAEPYPELRMELISVFNELIDDESAGIRSRSRNLIKRLKKPY